MNWWQRLWKRRHVEDRLDAELRDHFDRLVTDNIAQGMPSAEATRSARLDFGGLDQVKEDCRDARGTRWAHDSVYDLRFAARAMARDPWFTAVVVVSLALGIGVCSMAFTITDAYYFRGLPVERPDRMFHVGTIDVKGEPRGVSFPDFLDWRALLPDVDMAAFKTGQMSVGEEGRAADNVSGAYVSDDVFRLLNVSPATGRIFSPEDELPGRTTVALLGHRLWTERYGSDPSLTGGRILINGVPTTVLGVMPEGFGFPSREQIWLPLVPRSGQTTQDRSDRTLAVLARVRDNQSRTAVESAWRAIVANLATTYPTTNAGVDVDLVRFGEHQVGQLRNSPALMLPITAGIVLLIACTNVANLLLARAGARTRELAIRASVGATRWRIIRQLLVESLLLAVLGGLAGFGIATLAVRAVATSFFAGNVPYWMTFNANTRSVAAVGAFCIISTIIFGLAPALRASRRGGAAATLTGVRSNLSNDRDRWGGRLVAVQFALSVVLLGGAGLLMSSYSAIFRADQSIDATRFTTMRIVLPETTYASGDRRAAFYRQLEVGLASTPGVEAVTLANVPPFLGAPNQPVAIRGRGPDDDTTLTAPIVAIGSGYFETLELSLLRGRSFAPVDDARGSEVAIVNQLFVERFFPGLDPIGQQIRVDTATAGGSTAHPIERPGEATWRTVVGIAPTIRQQAPGGPRPLVYLPHLSTPALSAQVILRMPAPSSTTITAIRTRVADLDAEVLLSNVRPLAETLRNSRLQPQLIATVLGSLGIVALFLSTVGLYAITAHGVRQRTAEIGLRLALGGRPTQIVWLFVRRGMTPIVAGMLVGLAGAFGVGQLLRGLLIGTSATDPATFAVLLVLLIAVTVTACSVPAWRGTRVDPASTLRQD